MRYRLTYVLVAILALSAFLMPAAAAAAQSSPSGPRSLSSLAQIERYLSSIGVDLAGAVVQQGSQNYAGPDCPGSGWSCTTASVVVQMGVMNVAEVRDCTDTTPVGDTCTIIQLAPSSGGNNVARCVIDTRDVLTASQTCSITQTNANGGDNKAEVRLTIRQKGGSPQSAMQMATVTQTQTTGSGDNRSNIDETIEQESNDGGAQTQDTFQKVSVQQTSDAGRNFSDVHQSLKQDLDTKAETVAQSQNATSSGPDVQADVTQTSSAGANDSKLHQSIDQDEKAGEAATGGTQKQGAFGGGLAGHVTQTSAGVSKTANKQTEKQTQKAKKDSGIIQSQVGPIFCCTNQTGNDANRFEIDQSSDQSSNGTSASQHTSLQGMYITSGDGMIMQSATNNTEKGSNQASGTGPQTSSLSCSSFPGEGGPSGSCSTEPVDSLFGRSASRL